MDKQERGYYNCPRMEHAAEQKTYNLQLINVELITTSLTGKPVWISLLILNLTRRNKVLRCQLAIPKAVLIGNKAVSVPFSA